MVPWLDGKVALVTGGGQGIGRATALAMAREGARVVVADRDQAAVSATVAMIENLGGHALALAADVTDPGDVRAMVDATSAFGGIDCAVNNAGVAPHQVGSLAQRTHEWSDASFDGMLDVNLKGVFLCMKHEITRMLAQGRGGVIVNTASIAGLIGLGRACGYVASKHGVVGLTKTAALEYAADGIRVNAICPGFIATRMTAIARELRGEQLLAHTPMGRFGTPEEVAELVVWLCSARASYVTGSAYAVDGGWTAI